MGISLTSVAAIGFEPMAATIRASNGSLYDYVVIGEHLKATDGFDNAYDTISPGNLNADMGEPYISVLVLHPDWKPAMRELRGDIRSMAKKQEWHLKISSSLPAGTLLKLELQQERSSTPTGTRLTVKNGEGTVTDLRTSQLIFPAPKPGTEIDLVIIAEQR